jgi:hypothetical protein
LGNFRRLLIRWERRFGIYQSFFAVATMLLSVRVAARPSSVESATAASLISSKDESGAESRVSLFD